jgi:predicted metal-binding membrane protein
MTEYLSEAILKRDRFIVMLSLVGIFLLAWVYTIYLTRVMGFSEISLEIVSPHAQAWTPATTAAPMLLFYAKISRQRRPQRRPYLGTGLFLLGYLIVWTGFSAAATFLQWGLHSASLLSTEMVRATPLIGGFLLILAGAFQFSQLKNACLTHCRTPVGFIMTEWKEGNRGALQMGIKHGYYCVGCCWLLMALLFVAGVMNLLWMAIITAFVLIEKIVPAGDRFGRYAGVLFMIWGVWLILMEIV